MTLLASRWGRSEYLEGIRGTYNLVPVQVSPTSQALQNAIPRNMTLHIEYYQVHYTLLIPTLP
jgi:hypothetical protein